MNQMSSVAKRERFEKLTITRDATLSHAFEKMDALDVRLLCVVDHGDYHGLLSAGDIQRAIISNHDLKTNVDTVLRRNFRLASTEDSFSVIKSNMLKHRTEFMPVLNSSGKLVDVHFWEEVFQTNAPEIKQVCLPVVIMAGGKGSRLKPFSNILPKPLFPLGEKTIIETIMDRFQEAGSSQFYLSVNHKADFIRNYLDQIQDPRYQIQYFQEDRPLGTAGSLRLLRGTLTETFFVSNCDIMIDTDYSEIVDYHRENKNEITLVGALKHIKIPYGTVVTGEDGILKEFREKPELNYVCNTGLYLLEPHLIEQIPTEQIYHITDLIDAVQARDGRVGVFPVSEKSWCDIGEWHEYGRTMRLMNLES